MFHYPKMPNAQGTQLEPGETVWIQDKLDGTNLAWEWNAKRGWHRQGTRTRLFDASDLQFGFTLGKQFPELLAQCKGFEHFIQLYRAKTLTIVTELYGDGSFAGSHNGETGRLYLLDMLVDNRFLLPKEIYGDLQETPETIGYHGKLENDIPYFHAPRIFNTRATWNEQLVAELRGYKEVNEGFVVKSAERRGVWAKVKTYAYMERIKAKRPDNWKEFWE